MKKNLHAIPYLFLGFAILLTSFKCTGDSPPPKPPSPPKKDERRLTIYLVDVSGSFNKTQRSGGFTGKNFFELACNQIEEHIESAEFGKDHIIVRQISDQSYGEEAFVEQLNLCESGKTFSDPKPGNPYLLKKWVSDSSDFIHNNEIGIRGQKKEVLDNLYKFMKKYRDTPSNTTDLLYAFKTCEDDVKQFNYLNENIKVIVYSDFEETRHRPTTINLPNITVIGKSVPISNRTPEQYELLRNSWNKILNCDTLIFTRPEHTFKF